MGQENNMEIQYTFANAKTNWLKGWYYSSIFTRCCTFEKIYRNRQHIFPALVFYKHHFLHKSTWLIFKIFGEELRLVMLSHVAYTFAKKEAQFSSLSEFKIVTNKHKNHWIDLSEIWSNIGSSSEWQIKIKVY